MLDNFLITFIVPLYNTQILYLSNLMKPFRENSDSRIQLIVVDDGSDSLFINDYKQILSKNLVSTVFLRKENGGSNSARTYGIRHSRAKYVGFFDSDDCIDWLQLQRLIGYIQTVDSDVIGYDCLVVDKNGNEVNRYGLGQFKDCPSSSIKRLCVAYCGEFWLNVFKKAFIETCLPLFNESNIGEDLACVIPLMVKANSIDVIDCPVYRYVQHDSSMLHSAPAYKRVLILSSFENVINQCGDDYSYYQNEIEWQAIWHILYSETSNIVKQNIHANELDTMRNWMSTHFPNWRCNSYYIDNCVGKNVQQTLGRSFQLKLVTLRHFYLYLFLCKIKKFIH